MKGVVFTEFLEMVEDSFGLETVDAIISACDLPSGGVYTSVGTYPHQELVALVVALSERCGTPVPDLVQAFGRFLLPRLIAMHPAFAEEAGDPFRFLASIHDHIHVEVRKLYPDAELPDIHVAPGPDADSIDVTYRSERGFDALALGLIEGTMTHFGVDATIEAKPLVEGGGGTQFRVTRAAAEGHGAAAA